MDESYEWDDTKNEVNREKHGLSFELIQAFDWSGAVFKPDRRVDYGEERVIAYGRIDGRGVAVVYVRRGDRIRSISLRRAHEKEMQHYGL